MSQETVNPTIVEYGLCKEFKWDPRILKDSFITLPSFKGVLRWIFGKPLKILVSKGLDAIKIDSFLIALNRENLKRKEDQDKIKKDMELKKIMGKGI